jgi:hypothetical protein
MSNPAFYDYVHTYRGDCASTGNWDRAFQDVTVSRTAGGHTLAVTTSTALGGAVASVKVDGREYIASGGHGSALQWAFHAWRAGTSATECYNPTQAGSRVDDAGGPPWHGPSTSALYVHQRAGPATIRTESRPAMYISRADPNPGFGGCHASDFQPATSPFTFGLGPYWLKTAVALTPDSHAPDNVIRLSSELTSEDSLRDNFDGVLVAYLQRRFTDSFSVDPRTGAVTGRDVSAASVNQAVVRCTSSRAECLGLYFRQAAMPGAYYYSLTRGPSPYNGNSGEYIAQVTVPVTNVGAGGARLLRSEVYVAVGSLSRTVAALTALAPKGAAAPPMTTVDTVAPRVSRLRVRRSRATFRLSEQATVRIRLERRHRRWRAFRRPVTRRNVAAGRVRIALHKRPLPRGRYRLRLVATDRAGNRSRPARKAFRIR